MRPLFPAAIAAGWLLVIAASSPSPLHQQSDPLLQNQAAILHPRQQQPSCSGPVAGQPRKWWRAEIKHNGTTPLSTDSTFNYYRDVVQYGADNTGVKDSSDAFNAAIDGMYVLVAYTRSTLSHDMYSLGKKTIAWNRTGNTVTTRPAYVYIPPGTYLIAKPVRLLVYTFLIGDAVSLPTLVGAPSLKTGPVIFGYDPHQGDGSPTKNFYMALRNVHIDTSRIDHQTGALAIEWSVSQGCSLTNVHVTMPKGSNHTGLAMSYGGSGIILSDSQFLGGATGIYLFSQQYLLKGIRFEGCEVGIKVRNSYVTTVQGCEFVNCKVGIDAHSTDTAGAMSVVDSRMKGGEVGVLAYVSRQGSVVLDNFMVEGGAVAVKTDQGDVLREESVTPGETWVLGNT